MLHLPAGAELAVAQHLEDLLDDDEGARLVLMASATGDFGELAVYLANGLIQGVEVDVVRDDDGDGFEPEQAPRRRWNDG